jgi:dimethylargininase
MNKCTGLSFPRSGSGFCPGSWHRHLPPLCGEFAVLTRPGAASRAGEVALIRPALEEAFHGARGLPLYEITAPGLRHGLRELCPSGPGLPLTLEGGDVMAVGTHYFIGLSERTNAEGAAQLIALLQRHGLSGSTIPIAEITGGVHRSCHMDRPRLMV